MSVQIHKVEVESKIETNLVSLPFRTFLVVTWKRIMHVDLLLYVEHAYQSQRTQKYSPVAR